VRNNPWSGDSGQNRFARHVLPGRAGPVKIAVIVLIKVTNLERKHAADIARERLHDRKTFRSVWRKVFGIALPLRPSDRADAGLKRPGFLPDRIVFGKLWLFVRHAWIFGCRLTNFSGPVWNTRGRIQGNIRNRAPP
jgi:hypothetical protein